MSELKKIESILRAKAYSAGFKPLAELTAAERRQLRRMRLIMPNGKPLPGFVGRHKEFFQFEYKDENTGQKFKIYAISRELEAELRRTIKKNG